MRMHYLNGDRAAALRQFEQCAAALEEELNASASKGTVALHEQILTDQLEEPRPILAPAKISLEISAFLLPGILNRLRQLQTSCRDIQTPVRQRITEMPQPLT